MHSTPPFKSPTLASSAIFPPAFFRLPLASALNVTLGVTLSVTVLAMGCSSSRHRDSQKAGGSTNASSGSGSYLSSQKSTSAGAGASSPTNYHLRNFEEKTLPNGLRILFIPDESLPYVSYSLMIKSGSDKDPETEAGLAEMVAGLLDKGTVKRNATQIADAFGTLGADFDASAGEDYSLISIGGLSMHAATLLTDFAEVTLQPAFSDLEIERVRKQMIAHVTKRIDNPEAYSQVAFQEYVYGAHPYGHPVSGTPASLRLIKKKNLIQHYLREYRPNNAILAVVGKYSPEVAEKVQSTFGAWQGRESKNAEFSQIQPPNGVQIRLVEKPGLTQTQIRMGSIGIKRQNPDFLALRLANTILGGAFSSRLSDRVRIKLGLTYSIASQFEARADFGTFEIETFTKNASIGQTITETLKVLHEFKAKGVSADEVERTKGYLKGMFPAAIETPEKLATNLMLLRLYGIPDTYLTNYLRDIDHLNVAAVNQAITKYIDDKNIKILVYSTAEDALPQLTPIGQVEERKASEGL
jgi:zinc protease